MMPADQTELYAAVTDLGARFERVERAILGDPEAGHLGAIARLNAIDDQHRNIPEEHGALDERRIEGDRRLHQRIDDHEANLTRVEKKIDRTIWLIAGSGIAAFTGGWIAAGGTFPVP
jgi:hypothetical protein